MFLGRHHNLHDVVPLSKQLMLFYYHPIKHGSDQTKNLVYVVAFLKFQTHSLGRFGEINSELLKMP